MGALAEKKLFLLDMDGTIYLGDRLFDGTEEFLRRVRARGGSARDGYAHGRHRCSAAGL